MSGDLLRLTSAGLFCPAGGFHIDPLHAVDRAVVTHAHSDHCRAGHRHVLATAETVALARARLGNGALGETQAAAYGERVRMDDVTVWLAPAGHVLGSAQVVIERAGRRAVVSGDYKRARDLSCAEFELVPCDLFVTEATFGLPVFRHPAPAAEIAKLLASVEAFPERAQAVGAYALGKAQRLILELRRAGWERPIWVHGAVGKVCEVYEALGVALGPVAPATVAETARLEGEVVLAPPGALAEPWARRLPDPVVGAASGWMRVRQRAKQRGVELALVISDHADWDDLTATIGETGASEVWVTHGEAEGLVHWCRSQGIAARELALAGMAEEDTG